MSWHDWPLSIFRTSTHCSKVNIFLFLSWGEANAIAIFENQIAWSNCLSSCHWFIQVSPKQNKTKVTFLWCLWPVVTGKSLLSLICSVTTSKDICNFDCIVHSVEVKTNKVAMNLLFASALWRCLFVRVYFLWKSGSYTSQVYRLDRWALVAGAVEGRDCCITNNLYVGVTTICCLKCTCWF